jgi:mRNA capping enzyme, beta chain
MEDQARKLMLEFGADMKKYSGKQHIEIELRLGKLNHDMFDTNIGKDVFYKLHSVLDKYNGWTNVTHTSDEVFYWPNGVRCIYDGTNTIYQRKNKIYTKNARTRGPFDVRLGIAQELPYQEQTEDAIRQVARQRTSFLRKNVKIDMTVVTGAPADMDSEETTSYQVELEVTDSSTDQLAFSAIHKVFDIMSVLD